MSHRATITLNEEAFDFLSQTGEGNRSAYINRLLLKEKRRSLQQALMEANLQEAEDLDYQAELADWNITLSDGLGDES